MDNTNRYRSSKGENLCSLCCKSFATCESKPEFKSETDDAVISCDAYETELWRQYKRDKAKGNTRGYKS